MSQIEDTRDKIIREQNNEIAKANTEIIELKQKLGNVDNNHVEITPELNIQLDVIRLDKAIRRSEKRQRRRGIGDDTFIKLSNNLAYLISIKVPLVDKILHLSETVNALDKRQLNRWLYKKKFLRSSRSSKRNMFILKRKTE